MHELEKEIQAFFKKSMRIKSFERQLNKHYDILSQTKDKLINFLDKNKPVPESILEDYKKSSAFFGDAIVKERKSKADILDEIEKVEDTLKDFKNKLNS